MTPGPISFGDEARRNANMIVLTFDGPVDTVLLDKVLDAAHLSGFIGMNARIVEGYIAFSDGFGRIVPKATGSSRGAHYRPRPA